MPAKQAKTIVTINAEITTTLFSSNLYAVILSINEGLSCSNSSIFFLVFRKPNANKCGKTMIENNMAPIKEKAANKPKSCKASDLANNKLKNAPTVVVQPISIGIVKSFKTVPTFL